MYYLPPVFQLGRKVYSLRWLHARSVPSLGTCIWSEAVISELHVLGYSRLLSLAAINILLENPDHLFYLSTVLCTLRMVHKHLSTWFKKETILYQTNKLSVSTDVQN